MLCCCIRRPSPPDVFIPSPAKMKLARGPQGYLHGRSCYPKRPSFGVEMSAGSVDRALRYLGTHSTADKRRTRCSCNVSPRTGLVCIRKAASAR